LKMGTQLNQRVVHRNWSTCQFLVALAFLLLLLAGTLPAARAASRDDLLGNIPVVDENTINNAACGIAAATMILDYYLPQSGPIQKALDITAVAHYVPENYRFDAKTKASIPVGTNTDQLQTGLEAASTAPELHFGVPLTAAWSTTDSTNWFSVLKSQLDARRPIVLFLANGGTLGWSWHYGHYIVVSGYTSDDSIIYHDPWDGKPHTLPNASFAGAWGTTWAGNPAWWYMQVLPTSLSTVTPSPTSTLTPTLSPTLTPSVGATVTPSPTPTPATSIVPSPNASINENTMSGIAALTANDVWMVGSYIPNNSGDYQTLVEHWNGAQWSIVPSPNALNSSDDNLFEAAAVSTNDVWAVGMYFSSTSNIDNYQTLIEHWDGAGWSVVPSPDVGTGQNILNGVAAVSANDIWAVGQYFSATVGLSQTLIEHWNGAQWSVVPSPNVGSEEGILKAVGVDSSHDVWAVGASYVSTTGPAQDLVEHWDGSAWSIVSSPYAGTPEQLEAVAATSSSNAWAVGAYFNASRINQTLIEHWDGSAWSIVPSPNVGTGDNGLSSISLVSVSDIWAVGWYYNNKISQTLIEHWDGARWSVIPSPNVGTNSCFLAGVAAISTNTVWAVGYSFNNNTPGARRTLTEFYS
jgi:Peptidase_C39 like family